MKATAHVKCHNRTVIGILPENRVPKQTFRDNAEEVMQRVVKVTVKRGGRKVAELALPQAVKA